ncbi:YwqG family protein [Macrococcus armenti]|uniref:YwqG family protein n=1 Tax=Macrococcus armenti TaxID=2875764 RepID=UPI001CCF78EB|nr:DUF1963 domain-containing protein [Macrococcus armenti]UBH13530.1 DUF1963 domain-containing protein [Macrococcus armenti]
MLNIQDVSDLPQDEQAAYKRFVEAIITRDLPKRAYIRMQLDPMEDETLEVSKIGGVPFLKSLEDIPVDAKNKKMVLIAQINLSELPEQQTLFQADKGLLQFWMSCHTDEYGLGLESFNDNSNTALTFIEDVTTSLTLSEIITFMDQFEYEAENVPLTGTYHVTYAMEEQYLTAVDYRFNDLILPIWNEVNPEFEVESLFDGYDDLMEKVFSTLLPEQPAHQLGGYPYFTQDDLRETEEEIRVYDELLLQIDSEYTDGINIDWGDGGTANVFVKHDDLKRMKFDDYFYNWDCL